MAGMERFTQRARRVLSFAHQEAERARNNYIDPEHLLIGLIDEEGGVAGRVLRELGPTPESVRKTVKQITSSSASFDPSRVELAADTQQVLEYSVEEARRLGHHYIGTEHILLGLVRVEGTAMEVLRRLDITADQIRRQTRHVMNETVAAPRNSLPGILPSPQRIYEVLILYGEENQRKTVAAFFQVLGFTSVLIDNHSEIELGLELLDGVAKDVDLAVLILANDSEVEEPGSNKIPVRRAPQNLVYELGYFRGKLGRRHVCVLYQDNFRDEVKSLSAFTGVIFIPLDTAGAWMTQLANIIQEIIKPSP
jgi:predicted nucleotide-binding protein